MYKPLFLALLIAICSTHITAQKQPSASKPTTIPFRITPYNNIIIRVVVNKLDTLHLMLHTASSDITLTEEALTKIRTVKFNGTVDSVKSWGGNDNTADYSVNNNVAINDLNWENITIWKDKNSGKESDGKIGLNLFGHKSIEFDFDKNQLVIGSKLPRKVKKFSKLKLTSKDDNLFITGTLQTDHTAIENKFLIHSGYSGTILLDDEFVKNNMLDQKIKITDRKKLKDAFGNVLSVEKGLLPAFKISGFRMQSVPAGFFAGAVGRQKMSVLGGDMLKRFNFIIDADKTFIYLRPSHFFNTPFSTDS